MSSRLAWILTLGILAAGAPMPLRAQANRWETEIARMESEAGRNPPPRGAVMLYGSSSFRLWTNAGAAFPTHSIVNRGFGGSQLSDLNENFDRIVAPWEPSLLLIYGGDNDLAAGKTPQQVYADFEALVNRVRRWRPRTRIAFVAIKPSPSREKLLPQQREANERVRRFARSHRRVDYLDAATPLLDDAGKPDPKFFIADRLHLNDLGYSRWRGLITPYLDRWAP